RRETGDESQAAKTYWRRRLGGGTRAAKGARMYARLAAAVFRRRALRLDKSHLKHTYRPACRSPPRIFLPPAAAVPPGGRPPAEAVQRALPVAEAPAALLAAAGGQPGRPGAAARRGGGGGAGGAAALPLWRGRTGGRAAG